MKRLIISILTFVSFTGVFAQSPIFDVDGIYYRLLEDTTGTSPNGKIAAVATLGDLDHYKGSISIPATVTRDGVDYSVTTITEMAFSGCSGLTSISIPASVIQIPSGAFYGCSSLTTITVAPSNTKYDSRDNCNAVIETATNTIVASCNSSVIPESVPNIGECAFWGSKKMKELTISSNTKGVGQWAFLDCGDIETLYWNNAYYSPQAVTAYIYPSLKHVVLGDSVSRIYDNAFAGCAYLESIVIPSSLETIDNKAFTGCSSLTSISIPSSVTSISNYAFDGCSKLETVYWNCNDSIALLSRIFKYSKESLKNVVIGDAVTNITGEAFAGCTNLTSIKVDPDNKVYDSRDNCNGVVETASNTLIIGCKTSTVPEGITGIGDYAFKWCYGPDSFNLPSSLLSIGSYAFLGCDSLTSLMIPEKVNSIGIGITAYCDNLVSIKVTSGNPYYDSRENCNSIVEKNNAAIVAGCGKSVIPSGIKAINASAFEGCNTLKTISLPSSLQSIGEHAFAYCGELKTLSIPSGIKRIEEGLVRGCTSLVSIDIPSSVNYIGNSAFNDCISLESLVIPEGVTNIDYMFKGCQSLSYVSLPSTARLELDKAPFGNNPGLKTAGPKGGGYNLEFSWDTIPGCVFNYMGDLESVYIPKSVKLINDQNLEYEGWTINNQSIFRAQYFQGCYKLQSLAISFSDTKIMRRVSYGSPYKYEALADYYLYAGTGIRSITVLDDTIKTLNVMGPEFINEIIISNYVKDIYPKAFYQPNKIYNIEVENGNAKYSSSGGVLFNKDGSELIAFPMGKFQQDYFVPSYVTRIADYAFCNSKIGSVTISKNVERIGTEAFKNSQFLEYVVIKGNPEIDLNAFMGCPNVKSVSSLSPIPGIMNVFDEPQTIMIGDYDSFNDSYMVKESYNDELGRTVFHIEEPGIRNWIISITSTDIPAGKYSISAGILPSSDNLPNYLHFKIESIGERDNVILFDSVSVDTIIDSRGRKRVVHSNLYVENDISGYDSVTIVNSIDIPQDSKGIRITILSGVHEMNSDRYSSLLRLDRLFFTPLDQDLPEERFAGPFTEKVFNNATLYVPTDAVEAYHNADGWKLFNKIEVDTKEYPTEELDVNITSAGYATFYYSDADYILPSGLYAMVVSNITNDGRLVYSTVADGTEKGIVPAGVPVILATNDGQAGNFKLQFAGRGSYYYEGDNYMIGTDVDTLAYAHESSWLYKLSLGPSNSELANVPGWYWAAPDGGAFQIEAHKAWLVVPKSKNTRSTGYDFDGSPTGLIEIKTDSTDSETIIYDLYGRRLHSPASQGLMIINGKKVYIMEQK